VIPVIKARFKAVSIHRGGSSGQLPTWPRRRIEVREVDHLIPRLNRSCRTSAVGYEARHSWSWQCSTTMRTLIINISWCRLHAPAEGEGATEWHLDRQPKSGRHAASVGRSIRGTPSDAWDFDSRRRRWVSWDFSMPISAWKRRQRGAIRSKPSSIWCRWRAFAPWLTPDEFKKSSAGRKPFDCHSDVQDVGRPAAR